MKIPQKRIKHIIVEASKFAEKLALKKPVTAVECRRVVPSDGGVYVTYLKNKIVYIGKANNLKRRICGNHISASPSGHTSTLRELVHKQYGVPYGTEMREWILKNLSFAFLPIKNQDIRGTVEYLIITATRTPKLLNRHNG